MVSIQVREERSDWGDFYDEEEVLSIEAPQIYELCD